MVNDVDFMDEILLFFFVVRQSSIRVTVGNEVVHNYIFYCKRWIAVLKGNETNKLDCKQVTDGNIKGILC